MPNLFTQRYGGRHRHETEGQRLERERQEAAAERVRQAELQASVELQAKVEEPEVVATPKARKRSPASGE